MSTPHGLEPVRQHLCETAGPAPEVQSSPAIKLHAQRRHVGCDIVDFSFAGGEELLDTPPVASLVICRENSPEGIDLAQDVPLTPQAFQRHGAMVVTSSRKRGSPGQRLRDRAVRGRGDIPEIVIGP